MDVSGGLHDSGAVTPHQHASPSQIPAGSGDATERASSGSCVADSTSLWEWLVSSTWLVPPASFYQLEPTWGYFTLRSFSDDHGDVLALLRAGGVASLYSALPHSADAGSALLCCVAARPALLRDELETLGGMRRLLHDVAVNTDNGRAHRVLLFLLYFLIRGSCDERRFIEADGLARIWSGVQRCMLCPIGPDPDPDPPAMDAWNHWPSIEYEKFLHSAPSPDEFPLQAERHQLAELKMHLEVLHHLVGTHPLAADRFRRDGFREAMKDIQAMRQSHCRRHRIACPYHGLCAAWSSISVLESSILHVTAGSDVENQRPRTQQRELEETERWNVVNSVHPAVLPGVNFVDPVLVPGDGHCWWHAVSKALGTSGQQLQREMSEALQTVSDSRVLFALSLTSDPQLPAAEVKRVASAFLTSRDFTSMLWGGTKEMLLLSFARGGRLSFLTVNNQPQPLQIIRYVAPAAAAASATVVAEPIVPTMEVALHRCNVNGDATGPLNHWNLFTFRTQNHTIWHHWPFLAEESRSAKQHRLELLKAARARANEAASAAAGLREPSRLGALGLYD